MDSLPTDSDGLPKPAGSTLEYASADTSPKADGGSGTASIVCGVLFLPSVAFAIRTGGVSVFLIMALLLPVFAVGLGAAELIRRRRQRRGTGGAVLIGLILGGIELSLVGVVSFALFLPSIGRASPAANRVKCGSNLRQIGQGVYLYALENQGKFPPDIDALMLTQDLTFEVLVCPATDDVKAVGATTQATLQDLHSRPGRCSYVYIGGGLTSATATGRHVVAYEPLSNHGGSGMSVLYGDGAAEFLPQSEARYVLAELKAGHNPPRPKSGMPATTR
jgi:hypothetical protein